MICDVYEKFHTFDQPVGDAPQARKCACGTVQTYKPPTAKGDVIERFFHADNPLAEPDMRLLQVVLPAARESVVLRARVKALEASLDT